MLVRAFSLSYLALCLLLCSRLANRLLLFSHKHNEIGNCWNKVTAKTQPRVRQWKFQHKGRLHSHRKQPNQEAIYEQHGTRLNSHRKKDWIDRRKQGYHAKRWQVYCRGHKILCLQQFMMTAEGDEFAARVDEAAAEHQQWSNVITTETNVITAETRGLCDQITLMIGSAKGRQPENWR